MKDDKKKKKKTLKHTGISLGVLGVASLSLMLNGIGHIPLTTAQEPDLDAIMEEIQINAFENVQREIVQDTRAKVAEDIVETEKNIESTTS